MKKFTQKIFFLLSTFTVLIFVIFLAPTALAATYTISCPAAGTATEFLVYYHGYINVTGYTQYNEAESNSFFTSQINSIRSSRPGIVGIHVNGTDWQSISPSTAIASAKTQCNITKDLPYTVAGHSAGGKPTIANASGAQRVILLDAGYWDMSGLKSICSKVSIVATSLTVPTAQTAQGPVTFTKDLNTACQGKEGYKYLLSGSNMNDHFAVRSNLSSFYLEGTASSGSTGATSTENPIQYAPDSDIYLNIPLPGMPTVKNLAQYIGGVYKLGILFLAVICVIALLIGGLKYILSAGNPSKAKEGLVFIKSSVLGLILGLSTYLILYTINPTLVSLQIGAIENIQKVAFEEFDFDAPTGSSTANVAFNGASTGCMSANGVNSTGLNTTSGFKMSNTAYNNYIILKQGVEAACAADAEVKKCEIQITQTYPSSVSKSTCHHENEAKTGTCVDLRILIQGTKMTADTFANNPIHKKAHDLIINYMKSSAAVGSFLDEYTKPVPYATGVHFHVNLFKGC